MQFSELDLIYITFRALDLLSFPGDHQFNDMFFRKVPFSGTRFHIPEVFLNHAAAKTQTLPDIIKFIVVKFRDDIWQTARGLVLLRQHPS
jgi:hypothetical protein